MAAPLTTDEPTDRVFSRPVASLIVKLAAPTPITPNQITGIATLFGIAVGVALWRHEGWIAAACILGYLAFDCADGQLARLRGGGGYLGRAMDGIGDYITAIAVHVGLALWLGDERGSWIVGWVLSAAAGGAMAWASFLLDRYKRRYTGATDDIEAIQQEAAERGGLAGRLVIGMLPYAKRLDTEGVAIPDRDAYQRRLRVPMLLWLLNGPTMHFTLMAACCVLGRPALYAFIAVGPMLLVTLLTLWLQRRLEEGEPAVVTQAS